MNFNKLETFLVVAEERSITTASKRLHRTQSAISQQMTALEQELGIRLFERSRRNIVLTKEGKVVFERARFHLQSLRYQIEELVAEKKSIEAHLHIGVIFDLPSSSHFFTQLAQFNALYPKIRFSLYTESSYEIEKKLLSQQLDLGLLIDFQNKEPFERFLYQETEHILVASSDYVRESGPFDTSASLLKADLLDFDEHFLCLQSWAQKNAPEICTQLTLRTPKICTEDQSHLKALVLQNLGIALLPKNLLEKEVQEKQFIHLLPDSKAIFTGLDLARKAEHSHSFASNLFWDFLTSNNI